MAKSGEKRAFEDETVVDTLPKEELTVNDRAAINMGSTIQAQSNNYGIYPSPEFWNDLAAVSKDIHDTRRASRGWDFQENLNQTKNDLDLAAKQYELNLENERKTQATALLSKHAMDVAQLKEDLSRNGTINTAPVLMSFYQDQIKNYGEKVKDSPYLYNNVILPLQGDMAKDYVAAVNQDRARIEKLGQAKVDSATSMALVRLFQGDADYQDVGDMLAKVGAMSGPVLDSMSDPDGRNYMNKQFNAIVKGKATQIAGLVSNGNIGVDEGKAAIMSLIAEYGGQEGGYAWNIVKERDANGEVVNDQTIKCYLDKETISSILSLSSNLKNEKATTDAVYAVESFRTYVGWDNLQKGEFANNRFLMNDTPETAFQRYLATRQALEAVGDDPKIAKEVTQLDYDFFTTVWPAINVFSVLKDKLAAGEDISSIRTDFNNRIIATQARADKARQGSDDLNNLTELTFEVGGVVKSLAIMNMGENPAFDSVYRKNGQDERTARINYTDNMLEGMRRIVNMSDSEILAMAHSGVALAQEKTKSDMHPEILVKADAQGNLVLNDEGVNNLAASITSLDLTRKGAAPNASLKSVASLVVPGIAASTENLSPQMREKYLMGVGIAFAKAGKTGAFSEANMTGLTDKEQLVARQISTYAILQTIPQLSLYANTVYQNSFDPTMAGVTTFAQLNSLSAKNKGLQAKVINKFNEYKVPADRRSYLEDAIIRVAVAKYSLNPDKYEAPTDTELDEILSPLYTKEGVSKLEAGNSKISADRISNMVTDSNKLLKPASKKMKLDQNNQLAVSYNNDTGCLEIKQNNGTGLIYGYISGSSVAGKVPMTFDYTYNPGMDEAKFNKTMSIGMATAATASMFLDMANNPEARRYSKYYGGSSKDREQNIQDEATLFMSTIMKQNVFNKWKDYRASNYTNMKVMPAPAEFKNTILAAMSGENIGQGAVGAVVRGLGRVPVRNLEKGISTESAELLGFLTKDEVSHFIDFGYTMAKTSKKISMGVSATAGRGYENMKAQIEATGWAATDTVRNAPRSHHDVSDRTAVDLGFKGGFESGKITLPNGQRVLDPVKVQSLFEGFIIPHLNSGHLSGYIIYDGPELLENKPEYAAYAPYRALKAPDGGPLIRHSKGTEGDHSNHLHMQFKEKIWDEKGNSLKPTIQGAQDLVTAATASLIQNVNGLDHGHMTNSAAKAIATLWPNYKPTQADADYAGVRLADITDPIQRINVNGARFLRAVNIFRNEGVAFKAMAGGKFKIQMATASKSVKVPDGTYTLDQIFRLSEKGLIPSDSVLQYKFVEYADKEYGKKVEASLRKMGIAI